MQRYVFKIAGAREWADARAAGTYAGSPDDRRDGFIHFSDAAQVAGTLEKHFAGRDDLVLACIDAEPLGAALKWEVSRQGRGVSASLRRPADERGAHPARSRRRAHRRTGRTHGAGDAGATGGKRCLTG